MNPADFNVKKSNKRVFIIILNCVCYWLLGGLIPIQLFTRTRRFIVNYQLIDITILVICAFVGIFLILKSEKFRPKMIFILSIMAIIVGFIGLFMVPINEFPNTQTTSLLLGNLELKPTSIPYGLVVITTFGLNGQFGAYCRKQLLFMRQNERVEMPEKSLGSVINLLLLISIGFCIGSGVYFSLIMLFESLNVVFPSLLSIGSIFTLLLALQETDPNKEDRSNVEGKTEHSQDYGKISKKKGVLRNSLLVLAVLILAIFFIATYIGNLFFHSHYLDNPIETVNVIYYSVNFIIGFLITTLILAAIKGFSELSIVKKMKPRDQVLLLGAFLSVPLVSAGLGIQSIYSGLLQGDYNYSLWLIAGIAICISYLSTILHDLLLMQHRLTMFFISLAFTIGGYLIFIPIGGGAITTYGSWLFISVIVFSVIYASISFLLFLLNYRNNYF